MSVAKTASNPYVGLRPFEADDSLLFFGRRTQTTELLEILYHERFLAIVGSSGSGKSSLVRAGLVPRLRGGFLIQDRDRWHIATTRPGDAPMHNLAAALLAAMDVPDTPEQGASLEQAIRDHHTDGVAAFLASHLASNASVLLLVDQFEELFAFRGAATPDGDVDVSPYATQEYNRRKAEATDFVDLLLSLAQRRDVPVFVVLAMRTDFLGDCDLFYGLPEALNRSRYLVPRLTRQQLREAVEGPALLMRARIAPRLLDELLNQLGDRFDRLPVLQHALQRTWDAWQQSGAVGDIDIQHFVAAGGLEHALSKDAERAFDGLSPLVASRVFKRLTNTDASQRRVRSPARLSQLVLVAGTPGLEVQEIVRRFQEHDRNFLFASDDGMPDDPRIDISHESLIRQWPRLRAWVDEEREWRDQYLDLLTRARKHEQGTASLLRDADLQLALKWKADAMPSPQWAERYSRHAGDFASVMKFLDASAAAVSSEQARTLFAEQRARRLRRGIVAVVGASAVVFMVLAAFAVVQARKATAAVARSLHAALPTILRPTDPTAAALVLAEFRTTDLRDVAMSALDSSRLDSAMLQEFHENSARPISRAVMRGHRGFVGWAAFSADGSHVVTASDDSVARVWTTDNQSGVVELRGHAGGIRRVVFDPSGRRVLTASWDGTARLWQADGSGTPVVFRGHTGAVYSAEFNAAGDRIVTASADGTARIWNTTGQLLRTLNGHKGEVMSARFSGDGQRIVTASLDKTARIWQVDGAGIDLVDSSAKDVSVAAFSPDDNWIVIAGGDRDVRVVSARGGSTIILRGHRRAVYAAAFSADGLRLVTASDDSTARVWNVARFLDAAARGKGTLIDTSAVVLEGHANLIRTAAFSPDGTNILTASDDHTARLWHADGSGTPVRLTGHRGRVLGAWFDRDGRFMLTASSDSTARVWYGPLDPMVLRGHRGEVHTVEWNPRGDAIVTSGGDSTARVWSGPGMLTRRELKHRAVVYTASFSPIGARIVTASGDSSAKLWSLAQATDTVALRSKDNRNIFSARFSPDGQHIVTTFESGDVYAWRGDGSGTPVRFHSDTGAVWLSDVDVTGTLVAYPQNNFVHIWRLDGTGTPLHLNAHIGKISKAVFSPDGKFLAAASDDGFVCVWRLNGAASEIVVRGRHRATVSDLAFSADGKRVLSASNDSTVIVWSMNGDPSLVFKHTEKVWSARFSPDNSYVVSTAWDNTAILWPLDGRGYLPLDGHQGLVMATAFNKQGTHLATVSKDGLVRIWRPNDLLSLLRQATTDCLPVDVRVTTLGETKGTAQQKHDRCEAENGRDGGRLAGAVSSAPKPS